jgi:hypothetical protein
MRSPRLALALIALLLAGGLAAAVILSREAHRGTTPAAENPPPKLGFVRLASDAAHDYDPYGTGGEHSTETGQAVDGDPNSYWSTETYSGGLGKPGVGIYLDAAPRTRASFLELQTSTPGFPVEVYGAKDGPPGKLPDPWWVKLGSATSVGKRERIALTSASTPYRYFLLWITNLPAGVSQAKITELGLLRQG